MVKPAVSPLVVRELHLLPSGRAVVLELDPPECRRTESWVCAYRIRGLGRLRAGRVTGTDGVEALLLALAALRRELEPFGPRLTWNGEPGELGLPAAIPDFLGAEFRRRVENMVRAETERESRRLRGCVSPGDSDRP